MNTEEYKAVKDGLNILFNNEKNKALDEIPNSIKSKDGKGVDLEEFDEKVEKTKRKNKKTGWYIEKDKGASVNKQAHGGSQYKLFNFKGQRIATLSADGKVLRK
ncbi:hypothetical protein BCR36DRAFT_414687 [Piromyces finnis]|uniref:Uncharacterized protein n=1 Tax=Piromyces finnis TaxID=1754191 RepID=A0A1Y1V3S2_9FUNG|nr:hypothetical protein BCR36DRAFT_414687 [Piromyces finnis]|eukprot:ORX45227.1 hypothetical protein BCR36DRAFT_414687 [Piromyces finnis]